MSFVSSTQKSPRAKKEYGHAPFAENIPCSFGANFHDDPVTRITLNRPEKRNALSLALMNELVAALRHVTKRVVVIEGAGPVFSAGHDLSEMVGRGVRFYQELREHWETDEYVFVHAGIRSEGPEATDREAKLWLRIAPDEAFGYWGSDKVNKIYRIPEKDRTPLEQKVLDTVEYYIDVVKGDPVGRFIEDSTVEKSFRFLGKGVRLSDKGRVVCWYKLKGATTYRVVYGDLSIKDVPAEDLPLPVEP